MNPSSMFNRDAARAAGYTDNEIDQYMQGMGGQSAPVAQPKKPSFLASFGKALVDPIVDYGKYAGEAVMQGARAVADPTMRKSVMASLTGGQLSPEDAQRLLQQKETFLMGDELTANPAQIAMTGAKRTAGAMSYVAPGLIGPAGAGATIGKQALLGAGRGAITGALGGFSRSSEGKEVSGTLAGGAMGAGIGGALGAAGGALSQAGSRVKQGIAQRKAERLLQTGGTDDPKEAAVRTFANLFRVSKRKALRDLDPVRTSKELMMTGNGIPNDIQDFTDMHLRASTITGRDGTLSKMVNEAVDADNAQIPWSSVIDQAKDAMKYKLKFDKKTQMDVIRTMGGITPQGQEIAKMNARDALQFERELASTAAEYKRAWIQNASPEMKTYYVTYSRAANEVKRLIDASLRDQPGIVQQTITPERIQILNQAWPGLGDQVANVKTVSQLRALQSPFVNLEKLITETVMNHPRLLEQAIERGGAQVVAGLIGGSMFGPAGYLGAMAAGQAVSPAVTSVADKATVPLTIKATNLLQKIGEEGIQPTMQAAMDIPRGMGANLLQSLGGRVANPYLTGATVQGLQGASLQEDR